MGVVHVIDDDPKERKAFEWFLEHTPYAVETYSKARNFLATYIDIEPDIIVVDVNMPETS